MSTNVEFIEAEASGRVTPEARPKRNHRRRIEVTDMDAASVQRYVRQNVAADDVSFEHRGARTYLLVQD